MNEKKFNEKEIKERTVIFNNDAIPQVTKYLESIYQVSSDFPKEDLPNVQVYDGKIELRDR